MSRFINTVEVLGADNTLVDRIVERTVTEYKDNIATRVGKCAFRRCLLLAVVDMPNITYIDENAFNECSALKTLILRRTDSIVTLANANALANTPIAEGTGYIYVPSALVDAYKTDTAWSVYASQIRAIEDYPYVCDKYTWDVVIKSINEGVYKDVYKIGDVVPLDLGQTYGGLTSNKNSMKRSVVEMEIVAFDADDLADGSGKASVTWMAKELLKSTHKYNTSLSKTDAQGDYVEGTGTIGGWEKCEIRTYLKDTIKSYFPEILRKNIKEVNKYTHIYGKSGGVINDSLSIEDVWIPSLREVVGNHTSYLDDCETQGVMYDRFTDSNSRERYAYNEQSAGLTSSGRVWLRTPDSRDSNYIILTGNLLGGSANSGKVTSSNYIWLCFCT